MSNNIKNADDQKIMDLAGVIRGKSEVKTSTEENKPKDDSTEKTVLTINVSDPQPFMSVEQITYMRSAELSQIINELLSNIFVDYKDCNIYYNQHVAGIGCTVRFKFMTENEIKKADPEDKLVVAVSTPVNEIHENNAVIDTIRKINAINNNGSRYAILTKDAKEYLSDIVTKIHRNGKIEWDKVTNSNQEKITDYSGNNITVITLDVSLDITALLYKIFNGTSTCPTFAKNKTFYYVPTYSAALGGTEFLLQITRIDSKKRKEIADMVGYRCVVPSTWNTPVRM